jgi:hypothetical protein
MMPFDGTSKIHFYLFQPVAHPRLPQTQTIENKWGSSVDAFFHPVVKGRGSDPKSSTKSSTDPARPAATQSGIARRLTQIDADTEKKRSSSASICVICGQMPFFPNLLPCNSLDNSQR